MATPDGESSIFDSTTFALASMLDQHQCRVKAGAFLSVMFDLVQKFVGSAQPNLTLQNYQKIVERLNNELIALYGLIDKTDVVNDFYHHNQTVSQKALTKLFLSSIETIPPDSAINFQLLIRIPEVFGFIQNAGNDFDSGVSMLHGDYFSRVIIAIEQVCTAKIYEQHKDVLDPIVETFTRPIADYFYSYDKAYHGADTMLAHLGGENFIASFENQWFECIAAMPLPDGMGRDKFSGYLLNAAYQSLYQKELSGPPVHDALSAAYDLAKAESTGTVSTDLGKRYIAYLSPIRFVKKRARSGRLMSPQAILAQNFERLIAKDDSRSSWHAPLNKKELVRNILGSDLIQDKSDNEIIALLEDVIVENETLEKISECLLDYSVNDSENEVACTRLAGLANDLLIRRQHIASVRKSTMHAMSSSRPVTPYAMSSSRPGTPFSDDATTRLLDEYADATVISLNKDDITQYGRSTALIEGLEKLKKECFELRRYIENRYLRCKDIEVSEEESEAVNTFIRRYRKYESCDVELSLLPESTTGSARLQAAEMNLTAARANIFVDVLGENSHPLADCCVKLAGFEKIIAQDLTGNIRDMDHRKYQLQVATVHDLTLKYVKQTQTIKGKVASKFRAFFRMLRSCLPFCKPCRPTSHSDAETPMIDAFLAQQPSANSYHKKHHVPLPGYLQTATAGTAAARVEGYCRIYDRAVSAEDRASLIHSVEAHMEANMATSLAH